MIFRKNIHVEYYWPNKNIKISHNHCIFTCCNFFFLRHSVHQICTYGVYQSICSVSGDALSIRGTSLLSSRTPMSSYIKNTILGERKSIDHFPIFFSFV